MPMYEGLLAATRLSDKVPELQMSWFVRFLHSNLLPARDQPIDRKASQAGRQRATLNHD